MENSAADTKSASGAKGTEMDKPAEVNSKHDGEQYKLPDTKTLQEAGGYMIKDENGKETAFKSLYEAQEGRQLIIFIRHFFCGVRYLFPPPSSSKYLLIQGPSPAKNMSAYLQALYHPQPYQRQPHQRH